MLIDAPLPRALKTALRIVLITTFGQWFFLLNIAFFSLPLTHSIALFGALGVLHLALRRFVYSQRTYMPFRVAESASVILKVGNWKASTMKKGMVTTKAHTA